MMLIILAPQFLQFALISFGTSVNSFHADGLLYASSAAVPPTKKKKKYTMQGDRNSLCRIQINPSLNENCAFILSVEI